MYYKNIFSLKNLTGELTLFWIVEITRVEHPTGPQYLQMQMGMLALRMGVDELYVNYYCE